MEQAIILVLTLTSVLSLTFIIERGLALREARVIPPVLEEAVENCQSPSDLPMLRRLCEQHPSPLGRLLLVAANHLDCPKGENIDALQTKARHEMAQLERGLVVLEIITGIAPLLGLVGTVYGLILLFTGGVFYTVGAIMFGLERPRLRPRTFGFHELWHVMTVAAAGCHYALIVSLVH